MKSAIRSEYTPIHRRVRDVGTIIERVQVACADVSVRAAGKRGHCCLWSRWGMKWFSVVAVAGYDMVIVECCDWPVTRAKPFFTNFIFTRELKKIYQLNTSFDPYAKLMLSDSRKLMFPKNRTLLARSSFFAQRTGAAANPTA